VITTYIFQKCVSKFVMSFSFFLPKADEACYLSTKQNADSYWRSRSHLRMQIALWKLFREHILHDWNQDNGELRWISSVIRLLNFPPFCNCFVDMRCPSLSSRPEFVLCMNFSTSRKSLESMISPIFMAKNVNVKPKNNIDSSYTKFKIFKPKFYEVSAFSW